MPLRLDRDEFEKMVSLALDELPDWVREHMNNVAVTLALWPSREQLDSVGARHRGSLLGLYEGIPLTRRGRGYYLTPPDRITLFQRPLERHAGSRSHLVELIRDTIVHEVAHHFGLSDDHLRELNR
ncbi:MAG TPA: metallopeptidase family protein [Chloroflexi bacterium]|jgi:predicted Zn-dependent protease with MMP-like domain|nr:metallopeptidase family protein [Chloroflexota bacterium]